MDRPAPDWETIEREYRAGQLSVREIAKQHGLSDTAIRKRAKAGGWERTLVDKVRAAVREKLVRSDGSQESSHEQRAADREIVEAASIRGFQLVMSHRRDLEQLHGLKRVLADRLSIVLQGGDPEGVCLGAKESAGDLLEKLARVTSRLIPLERQAHNLDAHPEGGGEFGERAPERTVIILPSNGRSEENRSAGGAADGVSAERG